MRPVLIDTIAEVQLYVPVNMTSDMDVISPFIAAAENMHVIKLIGQEQFNVFKTAYTDAAKDIEAIADADIAAAITCCQNIISNLGYYLGLPVISLSIGSSGIQINSNENTKNAFQWQVNDLKDALMNLGFTAIESLLELLDSKTDKFSEYAASDQRKAAHSLLITSATDFNQYYEIASSRYVYKNLAYIMKRVEDQTVKRLLGADFFESIKSDADPGDQMKELINSYLKPGIALLTIAKGVTERIVSFQDGSVTVNFKGKTENMSESLAPTSAQIAETVEPLVADAHVFLQDGLDFIIANPDDFPDYVQPDLRRGFKFKNCRDKGVFGA